MKASIALVIAIFSMLAIPAGAQSLSAADAKGHVGEKATVCGKVVDEHTAKSSKGSPSFINLDMPYPHQVFTILIWGEDLSQAGELPRIGSRICATGVIQEYRGVPEIVVKDAAQLSR